MDIYLLTMKGSCDRNKKMQVNEREDESDYLNTYFMVVFITEVFILALLKIMKSTL